MLVARVVEGNVSGVGKNFSLRVEKGKMLMEDFHKLRISNTTGRTQPKVWQELFVLFFGNSPESCQGTKFFEIFMIQVAGSQHSYPLMETNAANCNVFPPPIA